MIAIRQIINVNFDGNVMRVEVDGKRYEFDLDSVSKKLSNATETERSFYKISPSGYGIHWPLIDEDLAIDKLIK